MKKYCVVYSITISTDTVIEATTRIEAGNKLKEVIPDAAIEDMWEIKDK